MNSQLRVWNLGETDHFTPTSRDLTLPENCSLPLVASISDQTEFNSDFHKYCDKCCASNFLEANWCVQCGSAFTCTDHEVRGRTQSPVLDDSNPVHVDKDSKCYWETSKLYTKRKPYSNTKKIPLGLPTDTQVIIYKQKDLNACMLNCPSEILFQIFSYLNHSDLFRCMLVCTRFYFVASDRAFWKTIILRQVKNLTKDYLCKVALKNPLHLKIIDCKGLLETCDGIKFFNEVKRLKSLTIEMSTFGARVCDVLLLAAANCCKELKSISIDWILISKSTVVKLIQSCSCLEEFSINHTDVSFSSLKVLFLLHYDKLRKLDIGSTTVTKVIGAIGNRVLPVLQCLVSLFNMVNGEIVRKITRAFPQLSSLHIHCTSSSEVQMQEAIKELHSISLNTLHFKHVEKKHFNKLSCSLLSQFSTLRCLGMDCIGDQELHALCQGELQLDTLDISGSFVTSQCFLAILGSSFCPSLRNFKINNCDGINDAAVEKTVESVSSDWCNGAMMVASDISFFINSCPRLQTVEVRGIHCAPHLKLVRACVVIR